MKIKISIKIFANYWLYTFAKHANYSNANTTSKHCINLNNLMLV